MSLIIAGDIGGTKTTLAIYRISDQQVYCINQHTYSSHDFGQFNEILNHFISKEGGVSAEAISLSVAGPIINNECRTTNLPWHISASVISETFNINQVLLFNDIEASGYGLLASSATELIQVNPFAKEQSGNRAIVSIGTGLGEAFLFWEGTKYIPCGTEGGHTDFAPLTESDIALWRHFKLYFPAHLSYERLLSGPGIAQIYAYLCIRNNIENIAPMIETSAWISKQAIMHNEPLCTECMNIFTRLLANEAANLCLKTFATGGVYITGGIAPKILPLLRQPQFIEHFIDKDRFKQLLHTIPIWINKNEQAPLHGALNQALKTLTL